MDFSLQPIFTVAITAATAVGSGSIGFFTASMKIGKYVRQIEVLAEEVKTLRERSHLHANHIQECKGKLDELLRRTESGFSKNKQRRNE